VAASSINPWWVLPKDPTFSSLDVSLLDVIAVKDGKHYTEKILQLQK